MEVSRRPAQLKDQDLLYNIKSHSLKPYVTRAFGWNEEMQRRIHDQSFDPESISIIQINGRDIGYIQTRMVNDNTIKIDNLLIHKTYQNQGIGSLIVSQEIKKAKASNRRIVLQVFKNNRKALKFYESLGLKESKVTNTHHLLST